MFDHFRCRPLLGSSPATASPTFLPHLENLEDRFAPAIIGGTAFFDVNNNGLMNAGEIGLGGATIQLQNLSGHVLAQTTSSYGATLPNGQTLAVGQYQFTQLDATDVQPTTQTQDAVFSPSTTDASATTSVNQFNPALGTLTEVDLIANGSISSTSQLENLSSQATQAQVQLNGSMSFQVSPGSSSSTSTGTLTAVSPGTAVTNQQTTTGQIATETNAQGTIGTAVQTGSGSTTGTTGGTTSTDCGSGMNMGGTTSTTTSGSTTTSTSLSTTTSATSSAISLTSSAMSEQLSPVTLGAYTGGPLNLTGASSQTLTAPTLNAQFNQVTLTDAHDLQAFTGTSTVNVSENANASACTCGPSNLLSMINTTAQGDVKVVYHYTPSTALTPGQYKVVQTAPPADYVGGFDTADNVTVVPNSSVTQTIPVTLQTGTDVSTSNNFGELQQAAPPPNIVPAPPTTPTTPATPLTPTTPAAPPATVTLQPSKFYFFDSTLSSLGW